MATEPYARLALLVVQLPSEREGYSIVGGSSSHEQVAAELGGWERPVDAVVVGRVLKRRRQEEAERANLRRLREARWKDIAEGRRQPLTDSEARRLWSDTAADGARRGRAPVGRPDPLDALTAAVDQVGGSRKGLPSHRQGVAPLVPVVTGPGGTRLLSLAEAARRTGIKEGTLRQRAARGSLEAVEHEGLRLREIVVEALTAKAAA